MADNLNSNNVVILIDQYTRCVAESIMYNSLAKHAVVLTDIREISDAHFESSLVFFEPAVPALVTPEILREIKEMFSIEVYLVYNSESVGSLFKDVAHCTYASYANIEWNLVYAVVHNDAAILEPYLRIKEVITDMSAMLDNIPEHLVAPVNRMYRGYIELGKEYSKLSERCCESEEKLSIMSSLYGRSRSAMQELRDILEEVVDSNRMYSALLSESYDKTFCGIYNERPRVLHIKQISHVSGIDNFIMTLYAVLTTQYKVSCKVVKLVDSTNALSLRYTPNNYFYLESSYSTASVLENDFLVSLGAYSMLFSLLMLNRSGLDVLIVHDLRGTPNDSLDANLIDLGLQEVSSDYAVLSEHDNIISDLQTAPFVWNYSELSKHSGTGSAKLANHPTIGQVVDYLL